MEYDELLDSFLPLGESDEGPTIRAAGEVDSSSILAVLQRAQQLSPKDRSENVLDFVYAEDMANQTWDTPLLRAISQGHVRNVELLLQHGADANGVDRENPKFLTQGVLDGSSQRQWIRATELFSYLQKKWDQLHHSSFASRTKNSRYEWQGFHASGPFPTHYR